jgi:glutamate synthase (NADPH/NADH) large chain
MMVPEAWENAVPDGPSGGGEMDRARRSFYEFHSALMEPWDGPACVVFTDGDQIGAVLDRNGLRPSRYWVTDDGLVVLASEVGVLDLDPATIVRKGRLQPGRMFLVDTEEHRIIEDDEIKSALAAEHPYGEWLHAGLVHLDDIPEREHIVHTHASVTRRQQIFGYTEEELRVLLTPMANTGAEPIGSMGTDTPIAALSDKPRLLFDYFAQLFAQVTNPPLDAIREELVTSLQGTIGPEANLLEPQPASCRRSCCRSRSSPTTTWPRSGTSTGTATCRASRPTSRAASTTSRAVARRWRPESTRSAPRSARRSPTGPGSSSSPTGTPPRSSRRSRRCS